MDARASGQPPTDRPHPFFDTLGTSIEHLSEDRSPVLHFFTEEAGLPAPSDYPGTLRKRDEIEFFQLSS